MRTIKHPLSGATYDLTDDGTIHVVTEDGRSGLFDANGRWLSGAARHADPHLCLWIGGEALPSRLRQAADAVRSETSDDRGSNPATIAAEELTS